jgi:hypothetical protein
MKRNSKDATNQNSNTKQTKKDVILVLHCPLRFTRENVFAPIFIVRGSFFIPICLCFNSISISYDVHVD